MKQRLPDFKTDEEAERFFAEADLTDYDLSPMRLVRFEFELKSERVNMRLPKSFSFAVYHFIRKTAPLQHLGSLHSISR